MISRFIGAIALVMLAGTAWGQSGSIPSQQFAPAPGGDNNYVSVQGTGVLPSFTPAVGLYLNYALDPLVLRRTGTGEKVSLIEHHFQLDLIAAVGFFDFLELGIAIPVTLYQAKGDDSATLPTNNIDAFTMGDIRLYPKWSIIHDPEGFGAALLAIVTLPSGSPENYQGNESVTFEPRLALQYAAGEWLRFALTGGVILREKQQLFNIDVGTELTFGAGVEYKFDPGEWAIILEGYGKVSLESDTQSEENPIELALAGRWWPEDAHAITLGVARGLTDGYGAPEVRVFAGYNYTPKSDQDPDGDGLKGDDDQCPYEPEDFDGYQDEDGCADPDNDNDGIPDRRDGAVGEDGFGECMNDPEDYDGFQDDDGCPDPDNDGDGILDVDDQCPMEPEDFDGFEDTDGCPDPDNDGDGIPDVSDGAVGDDGFGKCMNDPEDRDGFEDEDGCADPDNDGDGILDVDDECPDDPNDECRARLKGRCEIQILDKVHFHYDKDTIKAKSFPILDQVAEVLVKYEWIKLVEVQGHTDSDGTNAYNIELSQRRAAAVVKYMVDKGVDVGRMKAKGYGEEVPIADNKHASGRSKNRRVQFIILDPSQEDCKK